MALVPHFSEWVTKADLAVLGSQLATKADLANAEAAIINAITSLTTLIKTNHTATDALFKPLATSANVAAAQAAITQEITTMGTTLEGAVQAATTKLAGDIADVVTDLKAWAATIVPGSTVTQADVDALNAVVASADQMKATADALANPPPAPPAP